MSDIDLQIGVRAAVDKASFADAQQSVTDLQQSCAASAAPQVTDTTPTLDQLRQIDHDVQAAVQSYGAAKTAAQDYGRTSEQALKGTSAAASQAAADVDKVAAAHKRTAAAANTSATVGSRVASPVAGMTKSIGLATRLGRAMTSLVGILGRVATAWGWIITAIQLAKAAYDLWGGNGARTEEERTAALKKYSDACKEAAKNLIAALDSEKVENSAKAWQTAMDAETKAIQERNDALQQGLDIELQSLEIKAKMAGNKLDMDQLSLERQRIDKAITPDQYQIASAEITRQRDAAARKLDEDKATSRAQTAADAALDANNDADTTRLQYDKMRQAPVMTLPGMKDLKRNIADKERKIAEKNDPISALLGGRDVAVTSDFEQLSAIGKESGVQRNFTPKKQKELADLKDWVRTGRKKSYEELNEMKERLAKNDSALTDMNIVPGKNGEGIQEYQKRLKAMEEKLLKLEETAKKKNHEADAAKLNLNDTKDLNVQEEQKSDKTADNAQRSAEIEAQSEQLRKDAASAKTAIEESTKIVADGLKAFNDEMEKLLAQTDAESHGGYVPGTPTAHTREAVGNAINQGVMDESGYRALGNAYSELQNKPIKTQTDKRLMSIAGKLADQYKKTQPGQKANEDELADHAARLSKLEGGDVNDRTMASERARTAQREKLQQSVGKRNTTVPYQSSISAAAAANAYAPAQSKLPGVPLAQRGTPLARRPGSRGVDDEAPYRLAKELLGKSQQASEGAKDDKSTAVLQQVSSELDNLKQTGNKDAVAGLCSKIISTLSTAASNQAAMDKKMQELQRNLESVEAELNRRPAK